MTLGHVYDLDLKKNEQVIKDVIIQAQGEMALEEFIKQVCFLLVDFRAMLMFIGSRNLDQLYSRSGKLSEQMQID